MPDDILTDDHKHVTLIPTDRIRILNPRVRNRRTFEEMVETSITADFELRPDSKSSPGSFCFEYALLDTGQVAFPIQCPFWWVR